MRSLLSFPVLMLCIGSIVGVVSLGAIMAVYNHAGYRRDAIVLMIVELVCGYMAFASAVACAESAVWMMLNAFANYKMRELAVFHSVKQAEMSRNVSVKFRSVDMKGAPAAADAGQLGRLVSEALADAKQLASDEDKSPAAAEQTTADSSIAAPSSESAAGAASPSFDESLASTAKEAAPCFSPDALSGAATACGYSI